MFHHNKRPTTNRAPTDRLSERAIEHLDFPSALCIDRVREIKVADQIAKSVIVISRMQKRVKVKVFERTSVIAKVKGEIDTVGLYVSLAKSIPLLIADLSLTSPSMLPNGGPPLSMGWSEGG